MKNKRRNHTAQFKAKVAFEAAKGDKTIAQLASEYGVHPTQITQWRKQLLELLPEIFSRRKDDEKQEHEKLTSELYQQIGQLKVELDWLKKNLVLTLEQKRNAIEPANKKIPVYRQCELPGLNRSSLYYKSRCDTGYNEMLMKMIDKQYVRTPFYGIDKMTEYLCRQGFFIRMAFQKFKCFILPSH